MAQKIIKTIFQIRRDTAANWLLNKDVIPAAGEPCFEIDTGIFKIGNGTTTYENLPAIAGNGANAVLYTEQTLTNEQRKQARANISKYKWHTTKAGQINIILADHAPYISPTSTFDIELADQITSVSDPNDTCLGALAFYAKFSCPIIENINATRLEKMFIEFDALKDAGVLSSNSMYIAFKGVEEDTPILCVQLSTSSRTGFTHFYQVLSGNSYTATIGTVYWNKDTKTFENHITMNYSDDTLTRSKYAVAKAVGDALALKADQTALDEVNTLIGNKADSVHNHAVSDILDIQNYILSIINEKISTEEDITAFISEMNLANVVSASDGSVYTNNNGDIYIL